jgi:hypothetical protein
MKPLNKIRSNSKLGNLLNQNNAQEFFSWMFYKGYVVSFKKYEYSICNVGVLYYKWSNEDLITKDVVETYEEIANKFNSRREMYDMEDGTYLLYNYFYNYDGDMQSYQIVSTLPITELYKEYEKISNKSYMWLAMYASMFYLPYQIYGNIFEEYGGLTFDEIVDAAKWYDTNANYADGTPDREKLRDILLYTKCNVSISELEHGLWLKRVYLNEYVSKEDILLSWEHDVRIFSQSDDVDGEIEKMKNRVIKDGWLDDTYETINSWKKVA